MQNEETVGVLDHFLIQEANRDYEEFLDQEFQRKYRQFLTSEVIKHLSYEEVFALVGNYILRVS